VLVQGSPEAFGRVGCTLPAEVIPSMYDYQAYIIDVDDHEVHPVTRDFDPSISSMEWSLYDGQIYLTCENRDSVSLYRLDPATGDIRMLPLPEECVKGVTFASQAPVMAWYGQSSMNSDRLYSVDLSKVKANRKTGKLTCPSTCFEDLSAQTLRDVRVAECRPWHFTNSNGDDVLCRYYLPVGFDDEAPDAQGVYPMITYYYGGCSPTGRNFESSYPWQCWAALGYVVLVVQPSGAAGFGQEWASRHVNTAGVDPARDITEAVREFCRTHAYINKEKIGCCGASYGGFMTQYLQTLPDCPFACAISHAGISDHTTYWGYGYWGYSYSEVSMANSYPWSETDLYVKNSPIYNVDKIHTPILFLHGTKDVNVPINNSIQMFTALKLLGRETALVCVDGEDHGVVEYDKRMAWLRTQLAWFQKYLKDDSSWWDAMYPKKAL
jgi:dipeptidyl aminopeptidase/acylaminoacyl peptidase